MRTTCTVVAPAATWARLGDAGALAAALPGCATATAVAGGGVRLVVDVAVGAARGRLGALATPLGDGGVRVVGEGEAGAVDVVVRADPATGLVDVDGTVSGPLSTVGSGLLAAWVARTAQELLGNLEPPPPDPVTPRTGEESGSIRADPHTRSGSRRGVWAAVGAVGGLAASAGWAVWRKRRA